jgi:hypothetical protein
MVDVSGVASAGGTAASAPASIGTQTHWPAVTETDIEPPGQGQSVAASIRSSDASAAAGGMFPSSGSQAQLAWFHASFAAQEAAGQASLLAPSSLSEFCD